MAQLFSPVCADVLKLQNPSLGLCARSSRRSLAMIRSPSGGIGSGERRRRWGSARVATGPTTADIVADDYYAVLGLLPDATAEQIKKAYYNCMKSCHPDLSGNDPETTNFCMFINDVYEVLSDPIQRMVYDEIHGYALSAINPFFDDSSVRDHAFVDEFSCIGCKNCANVCSAVFRIEEDFGRARVHCQSGNPDKIQQAIDSCPVDCIHWTSAAQLSLLEDEMRRIERVNQSEFLTKESYDRDVDFSNSRVHFPTISTWEIRTLHLFSYSFPKESIFNQRVAFMLSGMGSSADVFRMASSRWEKRQAKVLEKAKRSMTKKKGSDNSASYWSHLWGKPTEHRNSEEDTAERARRAAAAARRWREYSRRGADKPPAFKLTEGVSKPEN